MCLIFIKKDSTACQGHKEIKNDIEIVQAQLCQGENHSLTCKMIGGMNYTGAQVALIPHLRNLSYRTAPIREGDGELSLAAFFISKLTLENIHLYVNTLWENSSLLAKNWSISSKNSMVSEILSVVLCLTREGYTPSFLT